MLDNYHDHNNDHKNQYDQNYSSKLFKAIGPVMQSMLKKNIEFDCGEQEENTFVRQASVFPKV